MSSQGRSEYAPILSWLLEKNPMYLLSAAMMAIGARLSITDVGAAAGDLHLILLTLAVLQFYEWLVIGLLLALHWRRRAPEDEPSLLLVAGLFWTGPVAATIEMTVLDARLGAILSTVVAIVAIAELTSANRFLRLGMSGPAWAHGLVTLILVATLPTALRATLGREGLHELVIYGGWWVFAACLPLGAVGRDARRRFPFTLILIGATAVHLAGMHHAFWCHSSMFYVSPVLISLAFVLLHLEARVLDRRPWVFVSALFLPVIAIGLCIEGFSRPVPIREAPRVFHEPMTLCFFGAAAIWYYACWLRPTPVLLHAGSAAVGLALYRLVPADRAMMQGVVLSWLGLYATVLYLLGVAWVRRSRIEFIAAILVHALWFCALIWGRLEADEVVIKSVVGWSVLGMIHVVYRRPELWIRAIPLFLLVQAAWSEGLTLAGILHSGSLIAFLVVLGLVFRWTSYLWIGVSLAAAAIASGSVQGIAGIARPRASLALLAAFLLLIIGGVVSWWKDRWLQKLSNATEPPDGTPREVRRN